MRIYNREVPRKPENVEQQQPEYADTSRSYTQSTPQYYYTEEPIQEKASYTRVKHEPQSDPTWNQEKAMKIPQATADFISFTFYIYVLFLRILKNSLATFFKILKGGREDDVNPDINPLTRGTLAPL